jgi:hypothetical protein
MKIHRMKGRAAIGRVAFGLVVLAFASSAFAQATRTWVSGVGDDVNPCSRTAPCKTFAGAISKTAAGGEISVLDPGGFGTVTITKSITIDGTGVVASIVNSLTNGINVNAGVNDLVVLRNLTINGAGTGLNGIRFLQGGTLILEGCVISGNTQMGVDIAPTAAAAQVVLVDTIVRNSAGGALHVQPFGGTTVRVTVDNSRFERSLFGIRAEDGAKVTVNRSIAANNTNNGFLATSGGGLTEMNLEGAVASNNGTNGIVTSGGPALIRISNSTVTGNATGLNASAGGQILSYGSNRIAGNTVNGAPTGGVAEQ